jgi:trehalose 6-phosphate synthase
MGAGNARLIVASNRLPLVLSRNDDGSLRSEPGSGGLVAALLPVLRHRGGVWVGWSGLTGENEDNIDELLARATRASGYALRPVRLDEQERRDFYHGFSNEIIWPLFHDLPSLCNYRPEYWRSYVGVNEKFAQAIAKDATENDFVWVHDYQLMLVGGALRRQGLSAKTGFFLHIPFPALDIFLQLPWRFELLHALLEYDLIGFQTVRDRRNFLQCLRLLVKDARVSGSGNVLDVQIGERRVRIGAFPIGIDCQDNAQRAADDAVVDECRRLCDALPDRQLILGIDRLDYTKGIPHRLEAFRNALLRYPELHARVTLIQVVVPSREDIPKYEGLKHEIERLVGDINGQFTRPGGWVPIHYVFRSLNPTELLAYYRAAEIALVTPLKDGMNLVAKEYCACSLEEDCVLILSEFAGAAAQLQKDALLVNPNDIEGVADAIVHAYRLPVPERRARMRRLRASIKRQDIYWWANTFLRAAIAKDLGAFSLPDDYLPRVAGER